MNIYFVRHGESQLTENNHQTPDTRLSKRGIRQISLMAQRFKTIPVDLIITSIYKRAIETANAIKRIKPAPLVESDLFIERKMPSLFLGKSIHDPEIASINQMMRDNFYDENWHYANEENFADLINRVRNALALIQSEEKENIVVVTHGYFLTVLVYYILFGDNIDKKLFQSFRNHTSNTNTGITACEVVNGEWKLLTWNDIAHLSE